jgi:transcriptional regulator GlxA family with amidase domain
MNTKLNYIQNWPELAQQAKWSAVTLAKLCDVSKDTLRRHLHHHMGKTTKAWLNEQRRQQAIELLSAGFSIKETAACLGYKHQTNFTRNYKAFYGACPSHKPQNPLCFGASAQI